MSVWFRTFAAAVLTMVGCLVAPGAMPRAVQAQTPIILDVDLSHFADDHEALAMAAELHRRGRVRILGVTLVAGNDWMDQIVVDALRAVERQGLAGDVPVFRGAEQPLVHSQERFLRDKALYGAIYAGAWSLDNSVTPPPDGPVRSARLADGHAVDFLIDAVRAAPGQVTVLALGPLTNLAIAVRKAPDIVPLIGQVIYMGGAVQVPGNVTAAAEFNWWFDPEAAAIVLAAPMRHTVVPLDATDRILFRRSLYDRFVQAHPGDVMVTQFLKPKFAERLEREPAYTIPVWDALVPALLADPAVVAAERDYWIGVDAEAGPNYGRTIADPVEPGEQAGPYGTRRARVILRLNEPAFWDIYEDLMFVGIDEPERE